MKQIFLTVALAILTIASYAQIKVHDNGKVSLGTLSASWNVGTQINPLKTVLFNSSETHDWNWVTVASPSAAKGKCWIVTYPGDKYDHRFFVTGYGYSYSRRGFTTADVSLQNDVSAVENARSVIGQIDGIWYNPADEDTGRGNSRRAGVTAQQVAEVLPEAVTADGDGLLYVDYETLTVFLIEAVKEQNKEIELLRQTLEEHGLLEPKE